MRAKKSIWIAQNWSEYLLEFFFLKSSHNNFHQKRRKIRHPKNHMDKTIFFL
jgi:hypothetical protein